MGFIHTPVLLNEIIGFLPDKAKTIFDFTLGGSNHSFEILCQSGAAHLYGSDRDADAMGTLIVRRLKALGVT